MTSIATLPPNGQEVLQVRRSTRKAATIYGALSTIPGFLAALRAGEMPMVWTFLIAFLLQVLALKWINYSAQPWFVIGSLWMVVVASQFFSTTSVEWNPISLVSIAAAGLPAFLFEWRTAAVVTAATIGFETYILFNPNPALFVSTSIIHGIPILSIYHLAFASSLIVANYYVTEEARTLDKQNFEQARILSEVESAASNRIHRQAMLQRLHETVLNTLGVITRSPNGKSAELGERCTSDLSVLEEWRKKDIPHIIGDIVEEVGVPARDQGIHVRIDAGKNVVLSDEVATRVHAILTELVANVVRHSKASELNISWKVIENTKIQIVVSDNGEGFAPNKEERIGIRRIVRENIEALNGQIVFSENESGGANVMLRIRLESDERALQLRNPLLGNSSVSIPLLAIRGVFIFALIASPLLAIDSTKPVPLGISIVSVALFNLIFITRVKPSNLVMKFIGVLLSTIPFIVGWLSYETPVSAKALPWLLIIGGFSGLTIFLSGQLGIGILAFIASSLFPVYAFFASPSEIQKLLLTPIVGGLVLVPSAILIGKSAGKRRQKIERQLSEIRQVKITQEGQSKVIVSRTERWTKALTNARKLMERLASDPIIDETTRWEAVIADSQLRAHLQIDPDDDGAFARIALELADAAAGRSIAFYTDVVGVSGRADALPYEIDSLLRAVVNESVSNIKARLLALDTEESMSLNLSLPNNAKSIDSYQKKLEEKGIGSWQYRDASLEIEIQDKDDLTNHYWINISRNRQLVR